LEERVRVLIAAAVAAAGALLFVPSASTSFAGLVGVIAFDRPGDANVDIYSMNADGSNLRNLSNNPGGDHDPRYSRDGSRIVFVSNRDGNWEIYSMKADGSSQTRLTYDPAEDELPAWTADDRIVFVSHRDGNAELYVMNADGSGLRRLTNDPAFDYFPAPAPTGDRVAFISDRDGTFDIYTMSIGDGSVTRVTDSPIADTWPIWSPDGTKIAFTRWNGAVHVLYTVDTDGSGLKQITNSPGREEGAPAWSPDGTRLAFLGCFNNNCDLIVRNADGTGGETTLLHGGAGAPDWQALRTSTSTPGSGGDSIVHAPEVSLRQQHAASRTGGPDYWRVTLGRGDELTVEIGAAGTRSLRLCILSPKIADDTSDNAVCEAAATTANGGNRALRIVAPVSGRWTLAVDGCGSCDRVFHPNDRTDVSYTLTATVRRYTRVTAHAPRSVSVGSWLTCSGHVEGVRAGHVELQERRAAGWSLLATRPIRSDGSFTGRSRFSARSRTAVIRVFYGGDAGHLPSMTTFAIRVGR
jgi:Tol biopolymer transport system component